MSRRLSTFVHVHHEDGSSHVFGPDDDVPAWAAKAITNDSVWEQDEDKPARASSSRSRSASDSKAGESAE